MRGGELAARLRALHATRRTLLVAIDGAGGSGKSRLADDLRTRLTASHVPTSIVEVDDFFLPSRFARRCSSRFVAGKPRDTAATTGMPTRWLE